MDFEFVGCHTIRDCPEYTLLFDEYRRGDDQALLIHFTFHKFSLSSFKKAQREWRLLRTIVKAPVFAVRNFDGSEDKWEHFVRLFGFKPTGIQIPCNNLAQRELFISTVSDGQADHYKQLHGEPATLGTPS